MEKEIRPIAYIRTDFPTKFGIPRQSGVVSRLQGKIYFEKEFSNPDMLRGIEGFSHIWLIWGFSENEKEGWSPTVRPPRLGGNERMGVFATRSPFRPNGLGMSCVRLEGIEKEKGRGCVLIVSGIDMMDNTPIYDIKPYLPYSDSYPDAKGGFTENREFKTLEVVFPEKLLNCLPAEKREAAVYVLSQDPRPGYHRDESREYGIFFADYNLKFKVCDGILTVCAAEKCSDAEYEK
ncbi:MAG: tRNA (N6-threonylcarbamoyladenosine(37)-N6)-methyltransferase TrmO [Clostridia bacterium]|nr:tRNA (N6-threonylcarbamoyladenosine(37)-N6)-methyltransferase TrmO [Clostridia bacterium]